MKVFFENNRLAFSDITHVSVIILFSSFVYIDVTFLAFRRRYADVLTCRVTY